jgi:hypothetical protein
MIFNIKQRCLILCLAYMFALEEMSWAQWIKYCCAKANSDCDKVESYAAGTHERTAAGWNIILRENWEHFPMPNHGILKNNPLPDLLKYF